MSSHTHASQTNQQNNQTGRTSQVVMTPEEEYLVSPQTDSDQILNLQQTIGNQATLQMLGKIDRKPMDFSRLRMAGAIQRDKDGEDDVVVVDPKNLEEYVDVKVTGGGDETADLYAPANTDQEGEQEGDIDNDDDYGDEGQIEGAAQQIEGLVKNATTGTPDDDFDEDDDDDTTTGGNDVVAPSGTTDTPDDEIDDEDDFDDVNDTTTGGNEVAPPAPQPDAKNDDNKATPQGLGDGLFVLNNAPLPSDPSANAEDVLDKLKTSPKKDVNKAVNSKNIRTAEPAQRRLYRLVGNYYNAMDNADTIGDDVIDQLKAAASNSDWGMLILDTRPDDKAFSTRLKRLGNLYGHKAKFDKLAKSSAADGRKKAALSGTTYKEGAVNAARETSEGFSLSVIINYMKNLSANTKVSDIWDFAVDNVLSILMKLGSIGAFAFNMYQVAYRVRKRNNAYYNNMKDHGFGWGTDAKQAKDAAQTDEDKRRVRLGSIAQYGYKKTFRSLLIAISKLISTAVTWLMGIITVLTGGVGIVFTGAVAAATAIGNSLRIFAQKTKGLIKLAMGKRGKQRSLNARELLIMAMEGDDDAIQMIWDANPFDEIQTISKPVGNKLAKWITFGKVKKAVVELKRPDSIADFKAQLTGQADGIYSETRTQNALVTAIATTMMST